MTRGRRGYRRGALLAAWAVSAICGGVARSAAGAPAVVALLAPPGARLGAELARELVASGFEVVRVETPAGVEWSGRPDALSAAPPRALRGVLVTPDDRRVIVFARLAQSEEVHTRIELQVDPRDRLVRRRVCLTVVEYLRVLAYREASPPSSSEAPPAPGAPPPPVAPAARAAPPVSAEPPAGVPAAAVLSEMGAGLPASHRRPWIMGVAATVDLDTALGESTGHFLFLWHFPAGPRLAIRALALWPLVGAQFQGDEGRVRMWTFGAAVGLQYAFVESPAPVRPFVGASVGTRLILTETTPLVTDDGASTFTPSVDAGLSAGVAFRISPVVQLFLESGATRDTPIPGVRRTGAAAAAASALSFNSSIGAMFEY